MKKDYMYYMPPKIKIGFKKRENTQTGKLAFVVYENEKKCCNERSFEEWIDHQIPIVEFDNSKPVKGIRVVSSVTSKLYHSLRKDKIRIFDPRGFEFEISTNNFMHLFDHENFVNGEYKGEVVYTWVGSKLTLISTNSEEYKNQIRSPELEKNKSICKNKIKESDLKVGSIYSMKNKNRQLIYMGCFYQLTNFDAMYYYGRVHFHSDCVEDENCASEELKKCMAGEKLHIRRDKDIFNFNMTKSWNKKKYLFLERNIDSENNSKKNVYYKLKTYGINSVGEEKTELGIVDPQIFAEMLEKLIDCDEISSTPFSINTVETKFDIDGGNNKEALIMSMEKMDSKKIFVMFEIKDQKIKRCEKFIVMDEKTESIKTSYKLPKDELEKINLFIDKVTAEKNISLKYNQAFVNNKIKITPSIYSSIY